LINQGLWLHPEVEATFCSPFISAGQLICEPEKDLAGALRKADLIFRADDEHFPHPEIDEFLDQEGLWDRVVYYDFRDASILDRHRLEKAKVYLKRSWPTGYDRAARFPIHPKLYPLDFALLNEYFLHNAPPVRDIDIAYMFPPNPLIGRRRYGVYEELQRARHLFPNSRIGHFTTAAQQGRRGIFDLRSPFFQYMRLLKRSKIVFTAFPDRQDGDSRTWEAFASGAMVCMDATAIPSPYPLQHGKHCIMYDARDRRSIRDAISQARYYLGNNVARQAIASVGHSWVLEHHKAVDRIEQVLCWLRSPEPKLREHVELQPDAPFLKPPIDYGFPEILDKNAPRPSFLGIGAQKAGTTWLDSNLRHHPGVFLPASDKELHFFTREYKQGLPWYLHAFREAAGRLCGEITPAYSLLKKEEIAQVTSVLPELKLIYILRNPIDRAWSAARMDIQRLQDTSSLPRDPSREWLYALCAGMHGTIERSDYLRTIQRWLRFVPENRLLLMRYDDLCKDPEEFFLRIVRFLELNDRIDPSLYPLRERFRQGLELPMPPGIRQLHTDLYAERIRQLERFLGWDLSAWTNHYDNDMWYDEGEGNAPAGAQSARGEKA
jgi:hypothetical protein